MKFGNNNFKRSTEQVDLFYAYQIQKICIPVFNVNQIISPVFKSNSHTMKPNNPISI